MDSPRIKELCCIARAALFNFCFTDSDLRSLGVWKERPLPPGPSPAVRCRRFLHQACLTDASWACRVTNFLDVQFMDTVTRVRQMDEMSAEQAVDLWVQNPQGQAVPALIWALCSDDRPEVKAVGVRLCHEAVAVACSELVEGPAAKIGER